MDDSHQRALNPNEYRCVMCGNVYTKGWTEEEAQAETQAYWPGVAQQDCAVVCDDCWQQIRPETHEEEYQARLTEMLSQQAMSMEQIIKAFGIPGVALTFVETNYNAAHQQSQEEAYKRLLNRYFRGKKS